MGEGFALTHFSIAWYGSPHVLTRRARAPREAVTMHSIRRLGPVLVALAGLLSLPAGRADALTAATGKVNVTVVANAFPPSGTITITATFDNATYDLPG